MRSVRHVVGSALLLVGLLVAIGPFISVWRAGGQMLHELPDLAGIDYRDERGGPGAMFDDDFTLAQRTFHSVDDRTVVEALRADGFQGMGASRFSKACCGDYDAVWADVVTTDDGDTVVRLTAADSDWQLSWPLFSGVGSLVAFFGVVILLASRSARRAIPIDHPAPAVARTSAEL